MLRAMIADGAGGRVDYVNLCGSSPYAGGAAGIVAEYSLQPPYVSAQSCSATKGPRTARAA